MMYVRDVGSCRKRITCAAMSGARSPHRSRYAWASDSFAPASWSMSAALRFAHRHGSSAPYGECEVEIEVDTCLAPHDVGKRRGAVPLEQQPWRDRGDSLRDQRLRRRDEHQRLLEQSEAADERLLLAAALGVVAGIRLVDRKGQELDRRAGQLAVDRDRAPQVAAVLAEREPRLVVDDLDGDILTLGKLDESPRLPARLLDDRLDRALDGVARHAHRLLPGPMSLSDGTGSGKQPVELVVRGREDRLVGAARPHAVALLDLVGVRGPLAREHARVRPQPA